MAIVNNDWFVVYHLHSNEKECILMIDKDEITSVRAKYWRDDKSDDVIFITLDTFTPGDFLVDVDFNDIHKAICHWFVDEIGMPTNSVVISDDTKNHSINLVARVQFIDDAAVMAKLQGILN